jgi:hypothetical protein
VWHRYVWRWRTSGSVVVTTDTDLARDEWLAERAAILEFEAGMSRPQAERMARKLWEMMTNDRETGQ